MSVSVRPAETVDAAGMAAIYNEAIEEGQATFETRPRTANDIAEAVSGPNGLPHLVALQSGQVLGWARLAPYSPRECYAGVGEASIYVARRGRGCGVGRRPIEALVADAEQRGYWKIVGLLFPTNLASVALCGSAGFREVGTLRRHGRLGGEWRDVLLVELLLGEAAAGRLGDDD